MAQITDGLGGVYTLILTKEENESLSQWFNNEEKKMFGDMESIITQHLQTINHQLINRNEQMIVSKYNKLEETDKSLVDSIFNLSQ